MKLIVLFCLALIGVTLLFHANQALTPAVPADMPSDARFVPTGYDLAHNERKGSWVACEPVTPGESDCRVTDAHGMVLTQGAFLAIADSAQIGIRSDSYASASTNAEIRWIKGPVGGSPIPVIFSHDGTWLVPREDRDALIDRWRQHPDEWHEIASSQAE